MKKLKNIILAVVLAFAFCLPVFAFVGCDTTKNEEGQTEPTFATVATDMTTTFNGYLASLVEQHTALAKKYNLEETMESEDGPAWEGDDERLFRNLSNAIENYWDDYGMLLDEMVDFGKAEDNGLYFSGFGFLSTKKTDTGFNYTMTRGDGIEFGGYGAADVVYEGNTLISVETTFTSYQYDSQWERLVLRNYEKQLYDFKTNTVYLFNAEAVIPEREYEDDEVGGETITSKEYWNGLEIMLDAYNSGKFTNDLLNDMYNGRLANVNNARIEKLGEVSLDGPAEPLQILRAVKKAGINLEYAKLEDIPEYSIFDGEDLPEVTDEEYDAINDLRDNYVLRENGLFVNEKELSLDYDATLDALTQCVQIAKDYKEWLENKPVQPKIVHEETDCWDETYPVFPYRVKIDDRHFDYFETMLDYLQNTEKSEWDGRLLYDVWIETFSREYGDDELTCYDYVDARPNMTEIDADGNHTYYFTYNEDLASGGEVFSFTLDTEGKVTAVELYRAQEQE